MDFGSSRRRFLAGVGGATAASIVNPDVAWAGQSRSVGRSSAELVGTRSLMQPIFENSLLARYLSKPVHARAVIDDMDSDRQWSITGIFRRSYSDVHVKAGKRALRLECPAVGKVLPKARMVKEGGLVDPSVPPLPTATLKFTSPQDWTRFNRLSLWVYVEQLTPGARSHLKVSFDCEGTSISVGSPPALHFAPDLIPGEWNHVTWELPEFQRDKVTSLSLSHMPMMIDDAMAYYIDAIELQSVDEEYWEGWQVAPGKIAFQHVGYLPAQQKLAIVSGTSETRFELADAASGSVVDSFPVKAVMNKRGSFQVLDFTRFTRPGRYVLRCGTMTTRSFPIADDLWHGTIEKVLNFFYGERCGFAVPGVHDVCHQDLQGRHEGRTKPINGGWHDASDTCQGSFRTGMAVYGQLQILEQLRKTNVRKDLQDRIQEEAIWGLDWLLKSRFGNGYRIIFATMRIYTDNKIGTADDQFVDAQSVPFESFVFAGVAAYAARLLKDADSQGASEWLSAAVEDYGAALAQVIDPAKATLDEAAFGTLASIELSRATGRSNFTDRAVRFGRQMVALQEQRFVDGIPVTGYFYRAPDRLEIVHDDHNSFANAPMIALRSLAETLPDHEDWAEWYGAALLHSEYYLSRGAALTTPYNRLPSAVWRRQEIERTIKRSLERRTRYPSATPNETDPDRVRQEITAQFEAGTPLARDYRLLAFPIWSDRIFHGSNAVNLSSAAALAAAAHLRNSPEAETLLREQMQWTLGGNPFAQSLMYGEGYDFQPLESYSSGNLVGALSVGMDSFRNDVPAWPTTNRPTSKEIWVVPAAYFLQSMATAGLPAAVAGSAPAGAIIREQRTGVVHNISGGDFRLALPPGTYSISYGGFSKQIVILGGGRYRLSLDPAHAIDISLSAGKPVGNTVKVTARLRGAGAHKLELRPFNCALERTRQELTLVKGEQRTISWGLSVVDLQKPWNVVLIPNGDMAAKQEVFGAAIQLATIS